MDITSYGDTNITWTSSNYIKRMPGNMNEQQYGARIYIGGMTPEEIFQKLESLGTVLQYSFSFDREYLDVLFLKNTPEPNRNPYTLVNTGNPFSNPSTPLSHLYEKQPDETISRKRVTTKDGSFTKDNMPVKKASVKTYEESYHLAVNAQDHLSFIEGLYDMLDKVTLDLEPNSDMSSWVEDPKSYIAEKPKNQVMSFVTTWTIYLVVIGIVQQIITMIAH